VITDIRFGIGKHLQDSAARWPERVALIDGGRSWTYRQLAEACGRCATALMALNLPRFARVATYMNKSIENAVVIYAACATGLIIVPINPKLKPRQVQHILRDCAASVLVTSAHRLRELEAEFALGDIHRVVTGAAGAQRAGAAVPQSWDAWLDATQPGTPLHSFVESDAAAILYTSGSTGMPKGVVLSHRNLTASAESVNTYFGTTEHDVVLALLPLSFDAGLSQLTSAIARGSRLVILDYLRAQEAVNVCGREKVTLIVGVPPLWSQLVAVPWGGNGASVRLFANTGGHMHRKLLASLRGIFRNAKPYLMYGLTEAFRSSYLDPSQIDIRPDSVGKALPNAELLVLREDGTPCGPGEEGELVHRGPFVAQGYWNDPARTAQRFRPYQNPLSPGLKPETAVWSGDIFKTDAEGFLYFVGRRDEMIKSSGYRISPTEIETALQAAPGVKEVAVFGLPDEELGEVPVAAVVAAESSPLRFENVLEHCRRVLPNYMVPRLIEVAELPRSPNGKIDRVGMRASLMVARVEVAA
jgi:acyl-CoA ligase (AMP-forming) (exosortase A-associated)